jgi:dephospho-CoA kinase
MTVVGLTGNYGSGKSAVAGMFRALGAITMDTDDIVRSLLEEPEVIRDIRRMFGEEVMENGAINRKRLADIVFNDPRLRLALEDILHPLVFERTDREISKLNCAGPCIVVIEAPVVFERGYQSRFDRIITVYTGEDVNMRRLLDKGISEADAVRRLGSQLPVEIKMRGSDFVIDNSGDIEGSREQVRAVYQDLLSGEKKHGNN